MVYLKELHVQNFKSWRGNQVIGPFLPFTCIIGTNGSGECCFLLSTLQALHRANVNLAVYANSLVESILASFNVLGKGFARLILFLVYTSSEENEIHINHLMKC